MNKKKNILVTGGAGFIGSHIVDALVFEKYNVFVFDNLSSGKLEYLNKKAKFINGDIKSIANIESVLKKQTIDTILHLAGQPSIVNAHSDPIADASVNFFGTINISLLAIKYKVKRLLYASSMTVYGNQDKLPIPEIAPITPVNYYGIAKFASEKFVHVTSQRLDVKKPFLPTSFRMFNVYGPRQSLTNPYQGVLAIFIGNVIRNEPITIYGDGNQGRDFIYIDDVVKVWLDTIANKKSYGNIYNLGSGKQTSILKLAHTIIKSCGKNPKEYPIIFKKERSGDQKQIQAEIKLAKRDLKIKMENSLFIGISKTVSWAKNNPTS